LLGKRIGFTSHKAFENAADDSMSPKEYARFTEMQFEKNRVKNKPFYITKTAEFLEFTMWKR